MVGWEELYVMVGNRYFFIVIVMCIKIEIVCKMIWRIFEIEEKNVVVIYDNILNLMIIYLKNILR